MAALVALALVAPEGALAQTTGAGVTAAPTILILDQDRLYAESLYGKALERQSADAVAKLAAENRQIEADLTAEEKALTDRRATMSASEFKPLAEAFDAKVEKLRAEQEAKAKALQDARDAGRKRFFQAAAPILANVMRQRGALAILNKAAVILSFDSVDVTDAALQAIDAELGAGPGLGIEGDSPTPAPTGPAPAPPPGSAGGSTSP
jgi:Skp family chaperone for outer membrane proteins